jgi:DNA-binding CsgD family transcriptional regulator
MEPRRDVDYLRGTGVSQGAATSGVRHTERPPFRITARAASARNPPELVDAPVRRGAADADKSRTTLRISRRERAVLQQLAAGASTEEAARELLLSPHTVRSHLRTVQRKLGARSRAHAVALAICHGLIAPTLSEVPDRAGL